MSNDSVRIMCPNLACRRILSVPGAARGKTVRCRNCSTNIKVPAVSVKATETSQQPKE